MPLYVQIIARGIISCTHWDLITHIDPMHALE